MFKETLSGLAVLVAVFLIGIFFTAMCARAALVVNVGVGKGALSTPSFERAGTLGYSVPISGGFGVRPEVGGFLDSVGGHQSSWFVALPLEFRARTPEGVYASMSFGPGYLHAPDCVLGGHFQFRFELAAGVYPTHDVGVGVAWSHLSSGGIYPVNLGRDWFMVQLLLPF